MKFKRICRFVLLLVFIFCTLSCGEGVPEETTELTADTVAEETTASTEPSKIMLSELASYNVVRPDGFSGDITSTIATFYTRLKDATGETGIGIKTDYFKEGIASFAVGDYEILIGETNRPESAEFLENLRIDDYGYALIGKKLVIAGWTTETTAEAMDMFYSRVLSKIDKTSGEFFSEDMNHTVYSSYDVDKLSVEGVSIGEYTIVYNSQNTLGEKDGANIIKTAVSETTGYVIDVYKEGEAPSDLTHIIYVGIDGGNSEKLSENQACVKYSNGNVYIIGNDSIALRQAAASFTADFSGKRSSSLNITYENGKKITDFDRSTLSAMSFNILCSSRSTERTQRVITMVRKYLPDTVGFQEATPAWMQDLKNGLSDIYDCVGNGRGGGSTDEHNPIFYKREVFTLIESGTKWLSDTPDSVSKVAESSLNRIFTYALLERKSDGTRIMVINTHFDHKSDVARQKQAVILSEFFKKYLDMPMVITGDFNTRNTTDCYKTIISAGVSDSCSVAESGTAEATFHNYGSSSSIIDFAFVNKLHISVKSYKVCSETVNGNWASDHHPVFIEYIPVP